jgi:protocatechuate 3,4-dioxygenase beta subunit
VSSHRVLDRIIAAIALLACFGFIAGLFDVALSRPALAPFAPPLPADAALRDAELSVEVVAGGDEPPPCPEQDGGASAPCPPSPNAVRGPGVPGATVRVFWVQQQRYYLAGIGRSAAGGRLVLRGLPRGRVWVLAEAPGLARASTQLVLGAGTRSLRLVLFDAYQLHVRVLDEAEQPLVRATVLVTASDPVPFGALTGLDGVAAFDRLPAAPWIVKASAPGCESVTRSAVRGDLTISLRNLGSVEVRVEGPGAGPSAGATVTIAGSRLWPARRAETDSEGVARIVGLLAGSYDLRAYRDGLVSETLLGMTLDRGAHETVTLRLLPGRMVTAVVTDGEGDDAELVTGADVVLVESGLSSFPLRGRTGADGSVTLGPIAPGPATLTARAPGFVAAGAVPVPEPLAGPVRLALLRGATLEGEVVNSRGYPVDGASIEIVGTDLYGLPVSETPALLTFRSAHFSWSLPGPLPLIPMGELGVMPGPVPPIPQPGFSIGEPAASLFAATTPQFEVDAVEPWVTRADGTFRAHPVTPGRVRALVRHPAYVEGLSELVNLAPGGGARVKVVLGVGATLEGRVVDDRGFPVAGARVDVVSVAGTFELTTLTASDGSFAFAAVPEQVWIGVARPEDLSRIVLREQLTVADGERAEAKLTLPAQRGASRVVVTDEYDRLLGGAQVTVLSLDPRTPLRRTLFTTDDGSAILDDSQGLKLRVLVEALGWTRAVRTADPMPETLQVTLRRGVTVRGTVTAVRGRYLLSAAAVTIISEGLRRGTITDQAGAYEIRDVPPGPVRLVVTHSQYATRELDAEVESTGFADRPFELDPVDLPEPGISAGDVVDAHGDPVAGARVAVGIVPLYVPLGVSAPNTVVTDAQGRFKLEGLSPGQVDLEGYAPGVGRGRLRRVQVGPGRTTSDVHIRLTEQAAEAEPVATGSVAITLGERGAEVVEVVVAHVAELSEAERAGLEVGDIILAVDGAPPRDMLDARMRLSGPAGSDVVVDVQRGSETLSLRVARERVRH